MLNYDDIKIIDEIYSEGYLFAQYGIYIKKKFKQKIFKIPVDIGLGCPHKKWWMYLLPRDGKTNIRQILQCKNSIKRAN